MYLKINNRNTVMTRFNTGNDIGSLSEEDLYDNSMNLDKAMNSTEPTWRDRFGVEKPTIDAALKSAGFMPAGFDFVTGGTLQPGDRNKCVFNPAPNGDNNWYRWNGVFPKVVPANSQPEPKNETGWVPILLKSDVFILSIDAAKKKKDFYSGQRVIITDYGLEFSFNPSRNIIPNDDFSMIDYDDEITILVDSGGMLQFSDWGKLPKIHVINKAKFSGVLKDRTNAITMDFYGDSETFGQAVPDTPNAQNLINVPTGFGDGSTHQHWRFNNNYPQWVASTFGENYLNPVVVNNLGYSGDRMFNALLRHRVKTNSLLACLCYGINDCLFSTNNGSSPANISNNANTYSVDKFAKALSMMVAKQILQNKQVVILGTVVFASLQGFDGSQFASAKLARAYNAAAKHVAETFGCLWIDTAADIFNQYSMVEITQEGTHLNNDGHKILGTRLAAALMLNENKQSVSTGSVLIANPNINVVVSRSGGNVLPNSTSTTPLGCPTNDKTTMVVDDDYLTIPFYAETDNLVCYINGMSNAQGVDLQIELDRFALQSDLHFKYSFLPPKPASLKSKRARSFFNRETENISQSDSLCFIIPNKGWHSVSIKRTSSSGNLLLDSILFESLLSVINSDLYGTTGYAIIKNKLISGGCKNIKSVSEPTTGTYDVEFSVPMVSTDYHVSCDIETGNVAVMYNVIKTLTGFSVRILMAQGSGAGMVFNPVTPLNMTCLITGGR